MNLYDALMLLIVVVCAVQGAWKGMAWQIAPIASLVIGYLFAAPLSAQTAHLFGEPPSNRLIAMAAIYAGVAFAVYLLVRSIKVSIDKLQLTEFDRHMGFIFGAVKGVLITLIVTFGLVSVSSSARDFILKSESSVIAPRIAQQVAPILPDNIRKLIDPYLNALDPNHPRGSSADRPQVADRPSSGTLQPRARKPLPKEPAMHDWQLPSSNRPDPLRDGFDDVPDDQPIRRRTTDATRRPASTQDGNTTTDWRDTASDEVRRFGRGLLDEVIGGPSNSAPATSGTPRTGNASSRTNRREVPPPDDMPADEEEPAPRRSNNGGTLQDRLMNRLRDAAMDEIEKAVTPKARPNVKPVAPVEDDFFGPSPN